FLEDSSSVFWRILVVVCLLWSRSRTLLFVNELSSFSSIFANLLLDLANLAQWVLSCAAMPTNTRFVANNSDYVSIVREERSESLVEYSVFPPANSKSGSFSLIRNGTNPNSLISIPSIFPAINTDSENDGSSESNETSPRFSHNSNSIVSLFPPARSATDSPENYEIIITNPSITITTSFSIPLIFPPTISKTETNDSCSESNQSPRTQFSFSSLFPPARSETDSSSSKNDEIILGQILPTPKLTIFSFTELKVATKNFSRDTVIGEGAFGRVFKGWLKDKGQSMSGKTKNFRPDTILGEGGFGQVFKGWLKDKGQSKSGNRMVIAVKETSPESRHGFKEWQGGSGIRPLPWDIRLKIAIGAARGLAFLHTSDKQVIHRGFKSSNILLDGSYSAKIPNFGLARWGPSASQSHVTTRVMGTYGYVAPEYLATRHLYVKSDVYSFGVVLVEILTGSWVLDTNHPSGKQNLMD
ncbi:putative serine/threonine-protein kinase pix13, partial [Quercus suber]